jgi:anti-sigma B factor antagonist
MQITVDGAEEGEIVLDVDGALDLATSDRLRAVADNALRDGTRHLVLDLAEVDFIDSTGVGALVAIRNLAIERAVTLTLRDPSEPARRILELSTLVEVFTVETSGPPA